MHMENNVISLARFFPFFFLLQVGKMFLTEKQKHYWSWEHKTEWKNEIWHSIVNVNAQRWSNFAPFEPATTKGANHCLENAVALVHEVTNYKTKWEQLIHPNSNFLMIQWLTTFEMHFLIKCDTANDKFS